MEPVRATAVGLALLWLLVACTGGGGASSSTTGGALPESPTGEALPELDRSSHVVALEDIHFDTFDGGSVPLSAADRELIDRLRDAIPPLDFPEYGDLRAGDWLGEDDLVLGYEGGDRAYAYPIKVLNFHEIVNDRIGGVPVLVSYCPLCRSGVVYDRRLEDHLLSFGNTSALHESDLVMYDRETNSYWWQVAGLAIVGTLAGERLTPLPSVTTTWGQWRRLHPETLVLTRETGYARPYDRDPFLGYEALVDSGRFPFPVSEAAADRRLDPSEVVLGVAVEDEHAVFPIGLWGDAAVHTTVGGDPVVVFSRAEGPSGNAFSPLVESRSLRFSHREGFYVDRETGTRWSWAGEGIEGPLAGRRLEALPSRTTFWFAYVAAFPDAEVHRP